MTTIATLFSGGEGVGVGARMAGLDHLWGIEYDAAIAGVARINGFHTITADVTTVDWSTLPAPDVLHASPPCPNFSVAKTNRGETEQDRAVAQAVCDAIMTLRPRIFTLENVRGYAGSASLQRIGDTLMALDYAVETFIVNAADYGVPQTRERLFLVARRGGWMRAPLLLPRKQRWIGWYEAIADIVDTLPVGHLAKWQSKRYPFDYDIALIDGSLSTSTSGKQLQVTLPDMPAPTQVSSWSNRKDVRIIVNGAIYRNTPRCMARWQGFHDEYALSDDATLASRIVGNAVPPRLYAALIGAILEQV